MSECKYETNYTMHVAGHDWEIDKVKFIKDFEGDYSLSKKELNNIHKSIAAHIISRDDSLTFEEFEFLCSISGSTFSECASLIKVNKSAVSQWKNKKNPISYGDSVLLKNFLISKIIPELERRSLFTEQILKTLDFAYRNKLIEKQIKDCRVA